MKSVPKNWIHKHVALQMAKEQGFRPVVFNFGGKMVSRYVGHDVDDWARLAEANPGASEILCGVTAVSLWKQQVAAAENSFNRDTISTKSSRFRGVTWRYGKWHVRVRRGNEVVNVGRFQDEVEAARAYDVVVRRLHGDFARVNFPT